uniref:Somatomedin B domain containing 1 n=1 Tax=Nannospalax galili TaxID=1026970 RepID=A0A8C6QI73_NANGA
MRPAVLLLLWLGPVTLNQKTGSCSHPQPLCCLGMNHHCKRGSCFCDKFCHVVPDCCGDHGAVCNPADLPEGSPPQVAQLDAITDRASHTPKMVLQMVLRKESPLGPARSNQDWVQSMVQELFQTSLSGGPFSITVKGIRKRA